MPPTRQLLTLSDLAPGDHLCCLYANEQDQRSLLTSFIRQGLEHHHKVVCIGDAHTMPRLLRYLKEDVPAADNARRWGQMVVLTQDDAGLCQTTPFDPGRMIARLHDATEMALTEGYQALRVAADMTWALRGCACPKQLVEYEAMLNGYFRGSPCIAVCQYDRRLFAPQLLLDVLRTHPIAIIGNELYNNLYYVPPNNSSDADCWEQQLRLCTTNLAEHKHAEEAQARLEAQLSELPTMASGGVTAAGIAHRLGNLLGVISANAQLFLEHPEARDLQSECAQKICQATRRASAVMEDLAAFARSQSDAVQPPGIDTVLDETLALVVHEFALQCPTLRAAPFHTSTAGGDRVRPCSSVNLRSMMPQKGVARGTGQLGTVRLPGMETAA